MSHYQPIFGSGSLWVDKGRLIKLFLNSGHYIPQIVQLLEEKLILPQDLVFHYYENYEEVVSTIGEFRSKYMNKKTIITARGVLRRHAKILFCYDREGSSFFLPGGKVEILEDLVSCLKREFLEECKLDVEVGKFLGCLECHWEDKDTQHQEFAMIFHVYPKQELLSEQVDSLEPHLGFKFLSLDRTLQESKILPATVIEILSNPSSAPNYLFENQIQV